MSHDKRMHLLIHGRVQGVAYRAYAVHRARELDLSGWVRNLSDSSVELLAEGDEKTLKSFEAWCQLGSPSASVSNIETQWLDFNGDLGPFTIRYG